MLLNKSDSILLLVDVQEKLTPHVLDQEEIVARCEWLLKLANRMGVPVLVSEQYPSGLGSTLPNFAPYYDRAKVIEKIHFSCAQEPNYLQALKQYSKNQVVIVGIETHVCVLQTAMELKSSGKEVFVVVDAVSSRKGLDRKYALKRMKQAGIHLVTSEMVFFEWVRKAGSPEFKALSKEFLQ